MSAVNLDVLSTSAQDAMRFAHASAQQRTTTDSATIDWLDLVFGILLAHPGTSPPQKLMEHFQFTLGDLKPADRLVAGQSELNGALEAISSQWVPILDTEAEGMFESALSRPGSDGVVHLRHLWGGMLSLSSASFADALGAQLSRRGSSIDSVREVTAQWLADEKRREEDDYAELLAEALPYSPTPIAVARYNRDHGDSGSDLLRLSQEIDAFAYLLASVELQPPLAIGMFGDWGSGKTFFMDSIKRRVDAITSDPSVADVTQRDKGFWRGVVQIDFNAWHYSEGDLLASLVDHLFTELERQTSGRSANLAEQTRTTWVQELTEVTAEEEKLRNAVIDLSEQETDAKVALEGLESAAQAMLAAIGDDENLPAIRDIVSAAVTPVIENVELGDSTVDELSQTLHRAKNELTRSRQIGKTLFGSKFRSAATVFAIALVPLVVFLIGRAESWAGAAWVGLFTVLGEGVIVLGAATRWLATANDRIDAAQAELERRRRVREQEITKDADAKRKELAEIQERVALARQKAEAAAVKRRRVEQRLDEPAYRLVQEFIRTRLEAGTYRDRLGLHAIVRDDLQRLCDYVERQNRDELSGQPRPHQDRMFNRIILYIDDLDRCPDHKVVQVLQAVHLLLSFDLFVVVVAVDDRWLSYALEEQYPVLSSYRTNGVGHDGPRSNRGDSDDNSSNPSPTTGSGHSLRPSDYLEKIFQIPFRVRPVGVDGRRRMIDGLLREQVRTDGAAPGVQPHRTGRSVGQREIDVIENIVRRPSRSVQAAADELTLTRTEYEALWEIAPLLGETPRSIKRFVNVYQLLKMMETGEQGATPPDYQVAALLLGLDEGRPAVASKVRSLGSDVGLDSIDELKPLCAAQPAWKQVDKSRFDAVDGLVRRFQFP